MATIEAQPLLGIQEKYDPGLSSTTKDKPLSEHVSTDWDDMEPTGGTTSDSRGKRSMAYRSNKTGQVHAYLDLIKNDMGDDSPMLDFFARTDALFCWSLFEHIKSERLRQCVQCLNTPLYFVYLTYIMLRSG